MIRALAIKELRESLGLIALATVCAIGCVGPHMGIGVVPWRSTSSAWNPFVNGAHLADQGLILGIFALALGLKQTAWEVHQGTFRFLLHRPVRRRTVFIVKLLVGAAAVVAVNAFMIGLYGWWAATAGNHPSPFFWSMTIPSWYLGVSLLLVYLSAFLSGLRHARWIGTRLVPVAFGGACVFSIAVPALWWYALLIGLPAGGALLIAIFYHVETSNE